MNRRNFLKRTAGGVATFAAANMAGLTFGQNAPVTQTLKDDAGNGAVDFSKWRGVNLGGWLVLEKWMVPSVYENTDALDEYSLCLTLGDEAKARLDHHRETFITADDFLWIKNCGLNAVRLPVGYWALEGPKPYVESARFIDFALDQCQKNGLKLLLDLHGAPGSQNGWDHSGRSGPINWPKDPQNIRETLRILESFAQKYGKHPALCGIELLNEPNDKMPLEILRQFYLDAYPLLRKHIDPGVAVVFHDSFRALAWKKFMQEPAFTNVILDTHLYQCFGDDDKKRTAWEQIDFAIDRKHTLDEMQREELPVIVGEWSLSLPGHSMSRLLPLQVESVTRAYAGAQFLNYENTRGWFFWNYKLEYPSEWNFRHCVESGLLPGNFTA